MGSDQHDPLPAVFSADAEVGRDLAAVDWQNTPLGAPEGWPQSLRTAVSIVLSSRFSMWMAWGPQLTFFCNAAYRRDTLGRKYPWALGRPASEVWAEIWEDIGPRIKGVLATGEATWDAALLLFLERSGYPEESYHTFSYSPLHDDSGHVVGMLCVVSEDTDRVIAQRRLATLRELGSDPSVVRSEEQALSFAARQLSHNLRDLPLTLTYLYDEAGTARLAGLSGMVPGHPAAPALLPPEGSLWPVAAAARGESVEVELDPRRYPRLPGGDWQESPTKALVMPLLQQGAAPAGFLVAGINRYRPLDADYRDFVTLVVAHIAAAVASARSYRAQQRRAEELAELDRAKTTFFSNISHEFRTPLTLIMGPVAEMRSRSTGIDSQARQELDVVYRNGLRLAKLVNTLLDFSRIEAGRAQARYEPVDLAACTAELASVFRSAIDRAGLEFKVDCPPLGEPVYIDRDMWEKVVLNLLSNALKFTFDGAISVAVRRVGPEAVVTVSDTGIGVSAAEMPRLFERFHRIEAAAARSNEGSGIGLALVKELVALHGGTIAADSAEGAGTTFTIRLPFGTAHLPAADLVSPGVARAPSALAEPYVAEALRWLPIGPDPSPTGDVVIADTAGGASFAVSGPPARVLVADDNADMREYVARLLRTAGYLVTTVTDGQYALEAVRAAEPDLVVSDVMMPRLDGLELVAALRADTRTAAVPVLLLSARAGEEASIEGLAAGADDYLVKPFAAAELLARVRANVELARLRSHQSRWRTALVDSLQEAFFICDERGAVVEVNAAFTDILGYGPDGLPYEPTHPWWPDIATEPEAHRGVQEAFTAALQGGEGSATVPVTHRDGHRVWLTINVRHTEDPETGRRVIVGSFRDVTAEHHLIQRESAMGELNAALAQADTVDEALNAAVGELQRLWQARRVVAAGFPRVADSNVFGEPDITCAGAPIRWGDLPQGVRERMAALRDGDLLHTDASEPGSAAIALAHPDGVLVVYVELADQRRFSAEDATLLTVLTGRLGQGLQRVHQLDQQREAALALQNAILGPAALPRGFAVRYEPASRPLQVGGDWYDVVDLEDGRIGLIVGDCVGHGLAAATVMGQLRSACRALLLERPSPSSTLTALDRFASQLPGARTTTAFCAVLTPETGELVYSSAGHPPPIMVHADQTVELLEDGRTIPLGSQLSPVRGDATVVLPPRATLLLYTDGLIERRRESLDRGISRAADVVVDHRATALDELADLVMARLTPDGGYLDDVAVLLYRQPAQLELEIPAEPTELAPTRAVMRKWLSRAGVSPDQSLNVLIAVGEALANAIEHGHRDRRGGTVSVRAMAVGDRLRVVIADAGSWKTPEPEANPHRGRGITLMRGLVNEVSISPGPQGTTVAMDVRIG